MERLTGELGKRIGIKTLAGVLPAYEFSVKKVSVGTIVDYQKAINKLARYENLEEQGRLIELPCKVGDTVYYLDYIDCFNCPYNKDDICEEDDFELECPKKIIKTKFELYKFKLNDMGTDYFLTREEAENKLKEMESE